MAQTTKISINVDLPEIYITEIDYKENFTFQILTIAFDYSNVFFLVDRSNYIQVSHNLVTTDIACQAHSRGLSSVAASKMSHAPRSKQIIYDHDTQKRANAEPHL